MARRRGSAALWLALFACLAVWRPQAAPAVVINDANTANTSPTTSTTGQPFVGYYNNVVSVNGASGVYLGDGWVITAGHVGAHSFVYDGVTYNLDVTSQPFKNADGTTADLTLFRASSTNPLQPYPNLPNVPIELNVPGVGSPIYDAGYGDTAGAAITNGYLWTNSGEKSWGSNVTANATIAGGSSGPVIYVEVSTMAGDFTSYDVLTQFNRGSTNTMQLGTGDSGGGMFAVDTNGVSALVGINEAVSRAGETLDGDFSVYVDLAYYAATIKADTGGASSPLTFDSLQIVPEPSSFALAALGFAGIAWRWRARRAKAGGERNAGANPAEGLQGRSWSLAN